MKPPLINPGMVRMYFCEAELTHVASLMAQQGKTYYLSPSEPVLREVNGPTPTNFRAAGQGHNSPGQQP